jgi:hypothetical protein
LHDPVKLLPQFFNVAATMPAYAFRSIDHQEAPMIRIINIFLMLLLVNPTLVHADASGSFGDSDLVDTFVEVHAVGIYEGKVWTSLAPRPRPDVRVVVDRPDETVVLLLGTSEPVRWLVETTEGTEVSAIIMHGHNLTETDVLLDGAAFPDVILSDLPAAYQPYGETFRRLVDNIETLTGRPGLSSFSGAYSADEAGFLIEGDPVYNPIFSENYLDQELLVPEQVPESFRPFLVQIARGEQPGRDVAFTDAGFVLNPDGQGTSVTYRISEDVPPISWPVGAALDPMTGKIFGVSFGGEGYLYAYDSENNAWTVESSMENADASGMIYDQQNQRLVLPITRSQRQDAPALWFYGRAGEKTKIALNPDLFAGYTDMYDPGNGSEPNLIPLAVSEDKLLLVVVGDQRDLPRQRGQLQPHYRAYVVSMASGAVGLAGYDGISALAPEPW